MSKQGLVLNVGIERGELLIEEAMIRVIMSTNDGVPAYIPDPPALG